MLIAPAAKGVKRAASRPAEVAPRIEPQSGIRQKAEEKLASKLASDMAATELRTVPEGRGAGTESNALAGQAGRDSGLLPGERLVDDAAGAGAEPQIAPRPQTVIDAKAAQRSR